jgi:DNA-binding MarR family transcriptional regulator
MQQLRLQRYREAMFMLHCDLSIITRGSEIFMTRCLADFGITANEVMILSYLYISDRPRQEDISDYFMLDKGTIAKTVQKLEKKGLIERAVNESDQREKVITLTDKGLCLKDFSTSLVRIWHEILFNEISEADMNAFERITAKIAANVSSELNKWESLYGKQKA